jgi:hypothetical protein
VRHQNISRVAYDQAAMMLPIQVLVILLQATGATDDVPEAPPPWFFAIGAVGAAFCWFMHSRWKRGRYFMSRFTTPERERAKLAVYGPPMLPSAISLTACTAILGIWEVWGLPTNAWSGYLYLLIAAVFVGAGCWAAKEWLSPSTRRMPAWMREG